MVVTVLPLGNYASGTRNLGPVVVPSDLGYVRFDVARCTPASPTTWPNAATTINLQAELSLDNGATWRSFFGFTAEGGIVNGEDGNPSATSYAATEIPQVGSTARQVRATLTVTNGPIRTSVDVELV